MFEKFYDFVGVENKNNVTDMSGFMDIYGGETFLNGLYRIHNKNDVKKWNEILKRAFPKFKKWHTGIRIWLVRQKFCTGYAKRCSLDIWTRYRRDT